MVGGSRIIAFGTGGASDAAPDEFLLTEELPPDEAEFQHRDYAPGGEAQWADEAAQAARPALDRAIAGAAFLVAAGWSSFFVWANFALIAAGLQPAQGAQLITQWATPVLLVGVGWLLFIRTSRREAARFADAARLLSEESARLETRLVTVNRELSLAREFIGAQARDLESLGRVASERISANAAELQSLIQQNHARLDAIGTVSGTALENMERLRGQLPVIASAAKDVTNNIGNAGRTAQMHLEGLIGGFNRLNEFGQASERQVEQLRQTFDTASGEFVSRCEALEAIAAQHLAAIGERGTEFRTQLEVHEVEALAAMRTRAGAMAEEFEQARESLESREEQALVSMRARIAAIRDEGAAVARSLRDGEARAGEDWQATLAAMNGRIAEIDQRIAALQASASGRLEAFSGQTAQLGSALDGFAGKLAALCASADQTRSHLDASSSGMIDRLQLGHGRLTELGENFSALTESSVRLFELVHACAEQGRTELPEALAASERKLLSLDERVRAIGETVERAGARGEELTQSLTGSMAGFAGISQEIEAAQTRLSASNAEHTAALSAIQQAIAAIEADSARIAGNSRGELRAALDELAASARSAVADLEESSAPAIRAIAEKLASESAAAIDLAMRNSAAETAGKLEQAAAHAAGVGREVAKQLRDQLAKVNELAGNLEKRVAQARERAEEQVDNDFARRAALITEALNSNAIDIAKALSSDVADTSWAAYLRGDRGIFTRRAVSLLDSAEARSIAQIYDGDSDFRDHVSRYIHDFEAILRQILSTRDGHSLGVTLLSSDMGKLYVALAQAIERLRA